MGLAAIVSLVLAPAGQTSIVPPPVIVVPNTTSQSLPRGPVPANNPGTWVGMFDYPSAAMREGAQGVSVFKVNVDATGVVTDCMIVSSSGNSALDSAACDKVTIRARFQPARDVNNKPTAGTFTNSVRWVIPKGEPQPGPQEMDSQISITFAADGTPYDCKVIKAGPRPPYNQVGPITCPAPRALPYKDSKGNAVSRRVIMTTRIEVLPVD